MISSEYFETAVGNSTAVFVLFPGGTHKIIPGDTMGYRIQYKHLKNTSRPRAAGFSHFILTCSFFLLFLALTFRFWPEGTEVLREITLPGNAAVTTAALEELSQGLKEGFPLEQALSD